MISSPSKTFARSPTAMTILACAGLAGCSGGGSRSDAAGSTPAPPLPSPTTGIINRVDATVFAEAFRLFAFDAVSTLDGTLLELNVQTVPVADRENGEQTVQCSGGGFYVETVSNDGASVSIAHTNCVTEDGVEVDGVVDYTFDNVDEAAGRFDYTRELTSYAVSTGHRAKTMTGSITVSTVVAGDAHTHTVTVNRSVQDDIWGYSYTANELSFVVNHIYGDADGIAVSEASGALSVESVGDVVIDYLPDAGEIRFSAGDGTELFVTLDGEIYSMHYTESNGRTRVRSTLAGSIKHLQSTDGVNFAPLAMPRFDRVMTTGAPATLDLRTAFVEMDFEFVDVYLSVDQAPDGAQLEITQGVDGVFEVRTDDPGQYVLRMQVGDWLTWSEATFGLTVYGDTDGDGLHDNVDPDDDGDSYPDRHDELPLDASEFQDMDGDGIGNNADVDDDDDGTRDDEDAYPLDSACVALDDGIAIECFSGTLNWLYEVFVDREGTLYLWDRPTDDPRSLLFRWDSTTRTFLDLWWVGEEAVPGAFPVGMEYVPAHDRPYVSYQDGRITYVDLDTGLEAPFASMEGSSPDLRSAGNILLAEVDGLAYGYPPSGVPAMIDDIPGDRRAPGVFNPADERLYVSIEGGPSTIAYGRIDQATGQVVDEGRSPLDWLDYSVEHPFLISPAGDMLLIGGGSIFNTVDLSWSFAVPGEIESGYWDATDGLIVLRSHPVGTVLERRDESGFVVEQAYFRGSRAEIFKTPSGYLVITTIDDHSLRFHLFQPSWDSDDDGALNVVDPFPLDPAAFADTDTDGYPDAWAPGAEPSDSTTGLSLDAYPEDAACYLPQHGTGSTCLVAAAIPSYVPEVIVTGPGDTLFLLSSENLRAFRYSAASMAYLSPVVLGRLPAVSDSTPTAITYAPAHDRLYVGYDSGTVTFVDMADSYLAEQEFVTLSGGVHALSHIHDYVFAQDRTGNDYVHYFYEQTGALFDLSDWIHSARHYVPDESRRRLYFIRDDDWSANDLEFERLSVDGIGGTGSTMPNRYRTSGPVVLSPAGDYVLIGSGDIIQADDMNWYKSLGKPLEAAVWSADGITTAAESGGGTRIDRYDASQAWLGEQLFPGTPLALIGVSDGNLLITHDGTKPVFTSLGP